MIVDAHVHFHACFRRDRFLDAAWENLVRAEEGHAANLGEPSRDGRGGTECLPYLLLAESPGVDYFQAWREKCGPAGSDGSWHLVATEEGCALLAVRDDGARLAIVAGRQVPTAERLEVLGLGTTRELPPGLPFGEAITVARAGSRIVCIPWGFGKWWFRRGRIVRRAIEESARDGIFLGDNAGRPRLLGTPQLLRFARRLGVRVLPGSDPFPLRRHETRVGTFCFSMPGPVDLDRPMERLVGVLEDGADPVPRGGSAGIPSFLRDQLALRLARRGLGGRKP